MSIIKRSAAIDVVTEGIVGRIVKASEHGDFSELKNILLHGTDGILNMDNKELARVLHESTSINYDVVDEPLGVPDSM